MSISQYFMMGEHRERPDYALQKLFMQVIKIALMCIGESLMLGILYILMLYILLPSTDGLKQRGFGILALLDPFIVTVLVFACLCLSLMAFPIALVFFWRKDVKKVAKILFCVCAPTVLLFAFMGPVLVVMATATVALLTGLTIFIEESVAAQHVPPEPETPDSASTFEEKSENVQIDAKKSLDKTD